MRTRGGGGIHVEESGAGESVLYLHSGPGRGGAWRGVVEAPGPRMRHVRPDLTGRGRSEPWPDPATYSIDREAEAAAEIVAACGGRAHLVGHSFGGAVAVRLACLRPDMVASLAAIEPQLIDLLRDAGEDALHAAVAADCAAVLADLAGGEAERGWARFIDACNGAGTWAALPERVKDRVRAMAPRMPMHHAALRDTPVGVAELAARAVPTQAILGADTTPAERRMAELVAQRVPGAGRVEIAGAGRMAPLTPPREVAAALAGGFARAGAAG